MAAIEIDNDYGYVIFVFVASVFVLQWMAIKIGLARKKYGIKGCQKASLCGNGLTLSISFERLEGYPVFLTLLFLGGLAYARISAVAGLVYIAGRIVYALGYYTGDPEKRQRGAFGYIGLITLLVNTIILGLRLLGILSFPKMTVEPYSHEFNCIMRAYQNTMENYPQFLTFTLLGGISYPKISAVCGSLWIISRIVYTRGNYSGDPEQKKYGAFGQFGMFVVVILNIVQALQLLGIV